ncbi:hypothetical protein AnigIFM63604_010327 [Aspergillus niger]|uniref:Contig An01c0210, genomic contig n=3 Tax=Aspergillus niger TaxID=5061 RepID=A2Q8Y5_ASPNC|nr:uncharacterized protein An01g06000 [Aspergillus niger]XP_025456017.1 uncharacterized protein BO96DRAFT_421538 [Aspergillus niger CBS 101883]RDH17863.1 hypothetical protein M747DRAFT_307722 [Aspergillus niger ATCC 13496]PYH57962.1 hypothetical protein BO96DRAFT_421538 [Aspergillus niger CBS 101883]CAK37075.1 unnamed protein product [Aspergillus niger]GJP94849.1 uncharacterized protein AlacWU_07748 [Aspergillus niger]GLA53237.1 hypothetical protein AnigIFM63604_010327 [Aspergillus niger]
MSTTTTPTKPTRITPDEQLHFLLSCIRHSNSGKIDFTTVAKECSIVTKAAAAKRYERLLKSHGINTSGSGSLPSSSNNTPAKKRPGTATTTASSTAAAGSTTPTSRKRKADGISDASKKAKGLKKMAVARAESLMQKKQHAGVGIKKEEGVDDDEEETEEDEEMRAALEEEGLSGVGGGLAVKEEAGDDEEGVEVNEALKQIEQVRSRGICKEDRTETNKQQESAIWLQPTDKQTDNQEQKK